MRRALILVGPEFEDIELLYPKYRLEEEGLQVVVAGPEAAEYQGKRGYKVRADVAFADVEAEQFDALVIPGGRAPERIRNHPDVKRIVRHFFDASKPVAAICHGPQVLISAGVLRGRRLTSYWGIKDDVINAGATWLDEPVVVDGNLVTARYPPDIPHWMREFIRLLRSG